MSDGFNLSFLLLIMLARIEPNKSPNTIAKLRVVDISYFSEIMILIPTKRSIRLIPYFRYLNKR